MRLVDAVFRQGHLSDRALVDAVLVGDRPAHVDRCDVCAERAVSVSRWLDEIREVATGTADAAFPPERLAVQHAQIMRRLEQIDQPSRVIAFPRHARIETPATHARRVSPAWVGIAAAAGLVLGVVGGQMTARLGAPESGLSARRAPAGQTSPASQTPSLLNYDLEDTSLRGTPAGTLDEMTPRLIETSASTRAGG